MEKWKDYIVVLDFMIQELKLSGNELLIYAVIHGFSRDGASAYYGGTQRLAEKVGVTDRCVEMTLKKLENRGLIQKEQSPGGAGCRNRYIAVKNPENISSKNENPEKFSGETPNDFRENPEKFSGALNNKKLEKTREKAKSAKTALETLLDSNPSPELREWMINFDSFRRNGSKPKEWSDISAKLLLKKLDSLADQYNARNRDSFKASCLCKSIQNSWLTVYRPEDDWQDSAPESRDPRRMPENKPVEFNAGDNIGDFL